MTVVSIVFAILLMTLTLASMQFSPRILVSFVRDRVTQWTLGVFLGTFLYCMAETGERFEGLLPPIVAAPAFAIRKPAVAIFMLEDYVAAGIMLAEQAADFAIEQLIAQTRIEGLR